MVSRQETARPLLTPGEVMQLPDTQEVIMVSGHPPAKATKIRYFTDSNFTSRVLPAPVLSDDGYADRPAARTDDWTGLPRSKSSILASTGAQASAVPVEGGHQLVPEFDKAEVIRLPDGRDDDLSVLDDETDNPVTRDGKLPKPDRQFRRVARLASLDPDDGIAL